jgi:hypothetical protein
MSSLDNQPFYIGKGTSVRVKLDLYGDAAFESAEKLSEAEDN